LDQAKSELKSLLSALEMENLVKFTFFREFQKKISRAKSQQNSYYNTNGSAFLENLKFSND